MKTMTITKIICGAVLIASSTALAAAQERSQIPAVSPSNVEAKAKKHLFSSPATKKTATENLKTGAAAKTVEISRADDSSPAEFPSILADAKTDSSAPQPESNDSTLDAATISEKNRLESISDKTAAVKTTATGGDSLLGGEFSSGERSKAAAARLAAVRLANATKPLTEIYRVGVGDVLDVRVKDASNKDSTLFTVLADGSLDYPLAGEPVAVAGLTTEEISAILTARIRLNENLELSVSVRDFASHGVSIAGAVEKPGVKYLKREAVPLFAVLAEAAQRPDARRAIVQRAGSPDISVDLREASGAAQTVQGGDAIRVLDGEAASENQFYFVGGSVLTPGQKPFHAGLTLTQAILAAGGENSAKAKNAIVWRQNSAGLLEKTEFNLRGIKNGKTPDPTIQAGDRIEIKN